MTVAPNPCRMGNGKPCLGATCPTCWYYLHDQRFGGTPMRVRDPNKPRVSISALAAKKHH